MAAKQSEINVAIAFSLQLVLTIVMITTSIMEGKPRECAYTAVLTVITLIFCVAVYQTWHGK
jgi:hypothetical protein